MALFRCGNGGSVSGGEVIGYSQDSYTLTADRTYKDVLLVCTTYNNQAHATLNGTSLTAVISGGTGSGNNALRCFYVPTLNSGDVLATTVANWTVALENVVYNQN